MDDFIEDSYLDSAVGVEPISPRLDATSPNSAFFSINSDGSDEENDDWIDVKKTELPANENFMEELRSTINETDCDAGMIRKILAGRSLTPDEDDVTELRKKIWPALLGVAKREAKEFTCEPSEDIKKFFEENDLPVGSINLATFFAQSKGLKPANWIYLVVPLLQLDMTPSQQYTILHPIATKLTPLNEKSLHFASESILVLLQYHEPELSQKLSDLRVPLNDAFSPFLSSLFAVAKSQSIMSLWDGILQCNDPILPIFLIVVLLINSAEQLAEAKCTEDVVSQLTNCLQQMEPDDIPDFIELAINYRDLSPRSHLEMRIMPLFTARPTSDCHESILCAEITASEALLSIAGDPSCLPFVLFDVRSPDAFNQCHLHSTMHLEESVDGDKLLAQLEHHIESLQMPPEETHVCLIGESKNDPTVISFVSQLLKKRRKYLSIINGGFEALQMHINSSESQLDPYQWLIEEKQPEPPKPTSKFLSSFSKFTNQVSSNIKSSDFGAKLKAGFEKTISEAETSLGLGKKNLNRPYRKDPPMFSIDDESEGSDDDEEQLNMEAFLHRKDIKGNWSATGPNNKKFILALSSSQMIICAPCSDQKWAKIKARRPLSTITRITSKKKCPEIITFRYTDDTKDTFHLEEAGDATREIKRQVVAVLDALGQTGDGK